MLVLLCEGTNDVIFLEKVLSTYCKINFHSTGDFNELTRKLKTGSIERVEEKYQAIIYGDRGKDNLIRRIIPHFTILFTGTTIVGFRTVVMLDDDYIEAQKILDEVTGRICSGGPKKAIPLPKALNERLLSVEVVSSADSRYRLELRIFLVPGSLEERLCRLFAKSFVRRTKFRNRLMHMSPHKCLDEIFSRRICSVSSIEGLIKCLIDHKLLDEEPWFQQLLKELCCR